MTIKTIVHLMACFWKCRSFSKYAQNKLEYSAIVRSSKTSIKSLRNPGTCPLCCQTFVLKQAWLPIIEENGDDIHQSNKSPSAFLSQSVVVFVGFCWLFFAKEEASYYSLAHIRQTDTNKNT
ncbi:hypothetical protein CEXT_4611 [Caerostris extrusa]|uniref:Uncharacterized protein n=1 Tax=Caerostris extrusa TaxID=172846 RepID=A0AAV4TWA9_CAEEX|nr:hypothetical protein CEXT_4611 [Caerostris extrusa]